MHAKSSPLTESRSIPVNPQLDPSWKEALQKEFTDPYFADLKKFLLQEKAQGHKVYPPGKLIFNAFNLCPLPQVKVVILGQDPYHGPGQAHGLCFSVPEGVMMPPSLKNIFKEMQTDLGLPVPPTGNLESWSKQGVLLLNASLTVRERQPGSHFKQGWERFTDAVIRAVSERSPFVVFLLWGKFAMAKEDLIDTRKHKVLKAPHPSPFSADRGFFGCRHFSSTNELLKARGLSPIDWATRH